VVVVSIHYEVISEKDIDCIKDLCNELMAYQKSKAYIHPEFFDNMRFETRVIPSVKSAKANFAIIAKDGDEIVGYAYPNTGIVTVLFNKSMEWLNLFEDIKDHFIFVSNGNDNALKFYLNKGFKISHEILDGFIIVLRNE